MIEWGKPKPKLPIMAGNTATININLVGCGGTGSFLALHLARLAHHHRHRHVINIRFVDFDRVEINNIGRQYFCTADVSHYKSVVLAQRMNHAYGLAISYVLERFQSSHLLPPRHNTFNLIIGAVDNHIARRTIHRVVEHHKGSLWWLDCGNHRYNGQLHIGNRTDINHPLISELGYCTALPAPSIQSPDLLEPEPDEAPPESCAELIEREEQSLNVNSFAAGIAAEYITQLISNKLTKYATYFDLIYGNMRSEHIT